MHYRLSCQHQRNQHLSRTWHLQKLQIDLHSEPCTGIEQEKTRQSLGFGIATPFRRLTVYPSASLRPWRDRFECFWPSFLGLTLTILYSILHDHDQFLKRLLLSNVNTQIEQRVQVNVIDLVDAHLPVVISVQFQIGII